MHKGLGNLLLKVERSLSPDVSARLRFMMGHRRYFYPFGTAMNGQTARLEATRQILYRCAIKQIIETGTFRGTTTEWFASFGLPVLTMEVVPQTYHFAKLRLAGSSNVRIEMGSSVEILGASVRMMDTSLPTLFYLDAHWAEYLPLREEMRIILENYKVPIILIDDFKVPDRPGYEYDDYGPNKVLEIDYLREFLTGDLKVFYPSTPPEEETGRRRGWVVLTPDPSMASTLTHLQLAPFHSVTASLPV